LVPILGIVIGEKFEHLLAAAQRRSDQGRPDPGLPDPGDGADEADRAFSVLWRDTNPALLRYLRVVAPGAAEDIAADTWVQVVRGLAAFRGDEAAWRAWLFTIARHRAIDEGRRRSRRPVVAGLDTPAVARLVGRSPGAVRVAAHRGLRQLAATLAEAGVTHGSPP
jgi:RNA polymerase sigma-70 factor (ECF subfamily)